MAARHGAQSFHLSRCSDLRGHFCAKRRRIKTVMQELIYRAGRLIETGRRLILGLGANDRAAKAFARLHGELFAGCT